MRVLHIALGGCLTVPPVRYGLTEDTGGHIAFVLAAAAAQARRPDVASVEIVTRAFVAPELGLDCRRPEEHLGPKQRLIRLATAETGYLSKEALEAEIPALTRAFLDWLAEQPRLPDVIHAHFADAARLAQAAADRFGCPTVYTPHSLGIDKQRHLGPDLSARGSARIAAERAALDGADAIVVSSRDEAERQVEAYGAEVSGRVHRVSPGATLAFTAHAAAPARARALIDPWLARPDLPMILAVARPVRRKNLGLLARTFAADPALHERANLVVLAGQRGPGTETGPESRAVIDELEAVARAPGMAGRIALPPRHEPEDVAALYRLAARQGGVFANVALHEPFGLTLLEAAQSGLPVVATREGGAADIVAAIGHGRLVDPLDAGAIAVALGGLLQDRTAWCEAAQAARRGVAAFSWDGWAAGVARVYDDIRAAPRALPARRLLACDIDATLTGSRDAARRFGDWAARRDMPFAVATGRSLSEARAVLAEWDLPRPDLFVTAVGTEIHRPGPRGRWHLCPDFAAYLDLGWKRDAVLEVIRRAGLALQPEIEQRRWKLACFGTARQAARLAWRLRIAGLEARVTPSHGRFVDILAPRGGKAAAVGFAARGLGIGLGECIAAGDSGNDVDMLQACGRAIVVANVLPELATAMAGRPACRARHAHADGVLEGLARLGVAGAADLDPAGAGWMGPRSRQGPLLSDVAGA